MPPPRTSKKTSSLKNPWHGRGGKIRSANTYFATANGAGLFNPSQVRDLRMPAPLIRRSSVSGDFTLTFGVEKSTAPEPAGFSPFPMTAPQTTIQNGKLEFQFTVPDNAAIHRLTGP